MKKLSPLLAWALLSGLASAAPYIVYSGTITGDNLSASGATNANTLVYLVTDVSDTSNFAVLLVNAVTRDYSVIARPSDSPATDEATNNFLGSVGAGTSARAVLSYSIETTDSSSNTTIVRAYATGPLTTRTTQLVPARKSLVVNLKTNRVANGTYTFSAATAAVMSGATPFALSFTGSSHGYVIDSTGALTHATTTGALALRENPALTGLANIGGGYAVSWTTEIAVMPVAIASGQSESDAFAAWLSAFAQANGFVVPASNNSSSDDSSSLTLYSGGIDIDDGTLALNGSFTGGSSLVTVGAGTLTLNGANVYVAGNPGAIVLNSSNLLGSVLTVGGLGVLGTNSSGLLSSTIGSGTLTINPGTLTLSGAGTIGSGGLGGPGPGASLSITIASATVTIGAINNGLIDGTVVTASNNTTFTFTGAAFSLNGSTDTSGLSIGQTITGAVKLSGGTTGNTALIYVGGTLTITTGATPASVPNTVTTSNGLSQ